MNIKPSSTLLYITAFLTGFSLMGYEILGIRILAPYFGTSVYVWGALISVFMLGLSIGYYLGGKLADKRKHPIDLIIVLSVAIAFIIFVSFTGSNLCFNLSLLAINIKYSVLFACLILFFVPCILLGIVQPYIVTLLESANHKIGKSVGNIYSMSTIGSIIGVLAVSFYFIDTWKTSTGIKVLCIPLLLSVLILLIYKYIRIKC